MHLLGQVGVLFLSGGMCSYSTIQLHLQYKILAFEETWNTKDTMTVNALCGIFAVMIGTAYPMVDALFAAPRKYSLDVDQELATFVRQLTIFFGLVLASAKFPFENNWEMSCTLMFMAFLVWWIGDRSRVGFAMSAWSTVVGTLCVQGMAHLGFYSYKDADFAGVRSWLPALLFAGCATCGSLGRQLAATQSKAHAI